MELDVWNLGPSRGLDIYLYVMLFCDFELGQVSRLFRAFQILIRSSRTLPVSPSFVPFENIIMMPLTPSSK